MKHKRRNALVVFAIWIVFKAIIHFLRRAAVGRVEKIHQENFPREGMLLICSNHFAGSGEEFGLLVQQLGRKVHFVYRSNLEKGLFGPLIRLFFRGSGMIPTKRGKKGEGIEAEEQIREVLEGGGVVALAPEGTSQHEGLIRARRRGIGRIAVNLDCPVLPVAFHNATDALTNGLLFYLRLISLGLLFRRKQRQNIKLFFGKAIRMSELIIDCQNDPEGLEGQAAVDAIMIRIGAMLPPEQRGEYADEVIDFLATSKAPDADFYRKLHQDLQPLVNP